MFRFRRSSNSIFPISLYEPKYLPEDAVLSSELLKQSRKAFKHLIQWSTHPYPITGTAAECSEWWANGKKDPKTALAIMAHFYLRSVEQQDVSQGQNLELESKVKSQDGALNLLNQKLHRLEEQNKNLKAENTQLIKQQLSEEQRSKQLSLQNELLNDEVEEREAENKYLQVEIRQQTETLEHFKGQIHFLKEKLKAENQKNERLEAENVQLAERLTASEEKSENLLKRILSLVQRQEDACLLNKQANGIATKRTPFSENSSSQAVPVIVVIKTDVDRGHACHIMIIQNAAEICQSFNISADKGFQILMRAMEMQNRLKELNWKDECENCSRTGHTIDDCRRPGGGAEVGLHDCYSCGMHGHWARNCWLYRN